MTKAIILSILTLSILSSPIETGELINAYALQDGGAVVIVYKADDINSQLVVVYINSAGDRDDLIRLNLPGALSDDVLTEVCGGRLHLTYVVDGGIWHETVDLPDATFGYLPLVCRESE